MRKLLFVCILLLATVSALFAQTQTTAQTISLRAKDEIRYCGAPKLRADGSIYRSTAVIAAFQRQHPCPSTLSTKGACPGWAIDHVIPLACGGCDAVYNMQWLPNDMKSSSGAHSKDRFERMIYENKDLYNGKSCTLSVVK